MLHHHLAISHSDHLLTFCNLILPSVSSKTFLCSLICDLKKLYGFEKTDFYILSISYCKNVICLEIVFSIRWSLVCQNFLILDIQVYCSIRLSNFIFMTIIFCVLFYYPAVTAI